jgi:tetrahydromethanopterin S-methyltransferase subunit G
MADEQIEITKAQYDSIIKRLDIMQETMDHRFQEWSEDRRTINDLEARLKTIEAKVEGARDEIASSQDKVLNKVDEHLSPMPDIVSEAVSEAVKKKKGLFK